MIRSASKSTLEGFRTSRQCRPEWNEPLSRVGRLFLALLFISAMTVLVGCGGDTTQGTSRSGTAVTPMPGVPGGIMPGRPGGMGMMMGPEMMQQHMAKVEGHMANIQALLRELVELNKAE